MSRLLFLIFCLVGAAAAQGTLDDTILVLDAGHGDRATEHIAADKGAVAETPYGPACECVFAWDTTMRVKRAAEAQGAVVFLTTHDPSQDYAPKDWSAEHFPQPGTEEFPFKTLVDRPVPLTEWSALSSRAETANRIYYEHSDEKDVLFLSLHFDSTNPNLEGVSFYYPVWCEPQPLVETLKKVIRECGRARRDMRTGQEASLAQPYRYAVLSQALNPDSYLVELGNIRSTDAAGENPDLWRMRNANTREAYAQLLVSALVQRERTPKPSSSRRIGLVGLGVLMLLLVVVRVVKLAAASHHKANHLA